MMWAADCRLRKKNKGYIDNATKFMREPRANGTLGVPPYGWSVVTMKLWGPKGPIMGNWNSMLCGHGPSFGHGTWCIADTYLWFCWDNLFWVVPLLILGDQQTLYILRHVGLHLTFSWFLWHGCFFFNDQVFNKVRPSLKFQPMEEILDSGNHNP